MPLPTTPPPDTFSGSPAALAVTSPFVQGVAVSKSDTVQLPFLTRALWVGGTGDVKVDLFDAAGVQTTVVFVAVPAGTQLNIRAGAVWSTGTSATNIVALR